MRLRGGVHAGALALGAALGIALVLLGARLSPFGARSFPATADAHPVAGLLDAPARLHLVYWPSPGTCTPQEMRLLLILGEFLDENPEVGATAVLPEGSTVRDRYGVPLPGRLAHLPRRAYFVNADAAPIPRLEVWNREGQLLLFRTLPGYGDVGSLLRQELLSALSTTAPVAEHRAELAFPSHVAPTQGAHP